MFSVIWAPVDQSKVLLFFEVIFRLSDEPTNIDIKNESVVWWSDIAFLILSNAKPSILLKIYSKKTENKTGMLNSINFGAHC